MSESDADPEEVVVTQPQGKRPNVSGMSLVRLLSPASLILLEDQYANLREDGLNIPFALRCLTPLDTILLEQLTEEGEKLPGMELNNQYVLKNVHGQRVLLASENTGFCFRCCFGSSRPFQLSIFNDNGSRVLNIERQCTLGLCCVCGICWGNEVEICHDSGEMIGRVRHVCSAVPTFEVLSPGGECLFIIMGPGKRCLCCKVNFKIYTAGEDRQEIGWITKEWGGILKESFTDADTFGIRFPKSLRTDLKAVLIGSTFLIDFTYFETHG